MAQHWLPVQGFDEFMENSDLGVFGSNTGEIEKGPTDLPPAPTKDISTTPQKRRAAAQNPSPRKKPLVAGKVFVNSSEAAMDKNKGEEGLISRSDPNEGATLPTNIINPDPEQSVASAATPSKNKKPKKANPKSSVDTEDISATPPKNRKTKVNSVPMPATWAEAGVADRMLVRMRDNGAEWANIRKQWKELTGSDTAPSTLPTRYSRLKASMMIMEDGDAARLIQAKEQVELRLETEKYSMIADTLEQLGGKRYSNVFIRKELNKLEKTGGAVAAHNASAAPVAIFDIGTAATAAGGGSGVEGEEGIPAAAETQPKVI